MKKIAVFLIFLSVPAASAVKLNLNLKKGDHFTTNISSTQSVIRDIKGNQTQVDNSTEMTIGFKVSGSDAAAYIIEMQYMRIVITSRGAGWQSRYDSSSETNASNTNSRRMNTFYQILLHQPITLSLDRLTGTIKSMSGWDKVSRQFVSALKQGTVKKRQKLADMFISSIQNGMVDGGPNSLFLPLPEKAVQMGSQWLVKGTIPMLSGLSLRTTYKITGLFPDKVLLSVSSSLSTSPTATPVVTGFTKTQYKLSGTWNGTLVVDKKTGWITQVHVKQELDGTLTMIDMGISFPVKLSGKTDVQSRQESESPCK